jgi:hypothetical protein
MKTKKERENNMEFMAGFISGIIVGITALAIYGCLTLDSENDEEGHEWNL